MGNSAAALTVVFAVSVTWGVAACATPAPAVSSPDTPKPAPAAREASPVPAAAPAGDPPSSAATSAASNAQDTPPSAPAPGPSARPDASAAAPAIPTGTAVLHIGDSFAVSGFAKALRPRLEALGVRYEVRAETSSFTTTWSAKMAKVVADTQPDLVIINLGANEVSNTDPTTHAPHVRKIVRAIGDRPCVWVSTPLWRKDTGINDVIRQNSAPCRFFDTDALVNKPIPRQSDHIHPTEAGGAVWADAFWAWLFEQRAPADSGAGKAAKEGAAASGPAARVSPWRLKPAPPEEHRAHGSDAPAASAPSP